MIKKLKYFNGVMKVGALFVNMVKQRQLETQKRRIYQEIIVQTYKTK